MNHLIFKNRFTYTRTRPDTWPSLACGWAGAVMLKNRGKSVFFTKASRTNGLTDRRTNGRTHPRAYKHLKTRLIKKKIPQQVAEIAFKLSQWRRSSTKKERTWESISTSPTETFSTRTNLSITSPRPKWTDPVIICSIVFSFWRSVFSRVHATLLVTMSVGLSVYLSLTLPLQMAFYAFLSNYKSLWAN